MTRSENKFVQNLIQQEFKSDVMDNEDPPPYEPEFDSMESRLKQIKTEAEKRGILIDGADEEALDFFQNPQILSLLTVFNQRITEGLESRAKNFDGNQKEYELLDSVRAMYRETEYDDSFRPICEHPFYIMKVDLWAQHGVSMILRHQEIENKKSQKEQQEMEMRNDRIEMITANSKSENKVMVNSLPTTIGRTGN